MLAKRIAAAEESGGLKPRRGGVMQYSAQLAINQWP
jgi:hypothetical protein